VELADQGYRGALKHLGNQPGEQQGDVRVVQADGESFTVPTTSCCWLGDIGLKVTMPDGRGRFLPAQSVLYVEDAPGEDV
jgi:hypothetical protein